MKPLILTSIPPESYREDGKAKDGGWRPLTNRQKAALSQLARKAHTASRNQDETPEEFRHRVAQETVGCRISAATQKHYLHLKRAFQQYLPNQELYQQTTLSMVDQKRRVAAWKLQQELTAKNLPQSYAEKICHTQYKIPLAQASTKQLWQLYYTLKNRHNQPPKKDQTDPSN